MDIRPCAIPKTYNHHEMRQQVREIFRLLEVQLLHESCDLQGHYLAFGLRGGSITDPPDSELTAIFKDNLLDIFIEEGGNKYQILCKRFKED